MSRGGRAWRALLGGVVLAATLSGCAVFAPEASPSPSASPIDSGIRGLVTLSPTCQSPTTASPCVAPYSARLIVLDDNGSVVGETTSAADGSFQITLPPGVYTIQPAPPANGDPFPAGQTMSVVVGDDQYTEVGVDYDTGIR